MERYCLHCNAVLHGRADKKFCDDSCRSTYYFEHGRSETDIVRSTHAILKKNRKILLELNPDGKVTVAMHQLTERGFNFDFHTSIYETAKGDRYHYCYEMGYLVLSERRVLLVVKDRYDN
ncbi:hypothetical protein [Parapedobacter sp. 2B3]|uniref:hypothetical protein n=1 Tax=Parapedobacter sp. 2B3 TaxID=3342381 RepID=UPI0035B5ACB6